MIEIIAKISLCVRTDAEHALLFEYVNLHL